MFISYGTKATLISTEPIMVNCPSCGKMNTMHMSVYQWYSHIFWIPFFPVRKQGVTHCSNCQQTLYHKQFNFDLHEHYTRLKLQAKAPIWTFSFVILLTIFCAYYIIQSIYHKNQNDYNILNPQKGDVYEVQIGFSGDFETSQSNKSVFTLTLPPLKNFEKFTLYKVDSVGDVEVYLLPNKYETNLKSGLKEMRNDTTFEDESFYFRKDELKARYDKGDILDINRVE